MRKDMLKCKFLMPHPFKNKSIGMLLILMLVIFTQNIMAQDVNNDETQIVAKCFTFQPLLDKIPTKVKDQMTTYQVLNKDLNVTLPSTLIVAGKSISLISDATNGTSNSFYKFHFIKVDDYKAFVRYSFVFNENGVSKKVQVHVEFEKKNSEWIVSNNNYVSDILKY